MSVKARFASLQSRTRPHFVLRVDVTKVAMWDYYHVCEPDRVITSAVLYNSLKFQFQKRKSCVRCVVVEV